MEILDDVNEIYEDLRKLDDLYNKEYLGLKEYYEIKNNILLKLSGIAESERESNKTKMELL